jgi:putative ABC transport system permease protein
MASIARRNLFEDIPRFLVAQAGIMFAVSLVTIQTGILDGFSRSTVRVIDESSADLWVASPDMLHLEISSQLTFEQLVQARQVEGVERAEALFTQGIRWKSVDGQLETVRLYGFNPDGQLFANWTPVQGSLSNLKVPYSILVDQSKLSDLGLKQIGDTGKMGSLQAKLVGTVNDLQSMASSTFVFTSLESANAFVFSGLTSQVTCSRREGGDLQCFNVFENAPKKNASQPQPPPKKLSLTDPLTYVLVKAKPDQDLDSLRRRLETAMPNTRVYTKAEMVTITQDYWRERTGVGFILGLGKVVGFVVGMVVVSQILYSSVTDHLREFGTLKAMGASDWFIYRVITEQALWMAVLGYIPSMLLCWGLSVWTMSAKGIMILITPATAFGVLGLTVLMCVGSALFAIQKVTHVDPAIVFKA